MKLELKHLSPYLPFGLQIEHPTMLVGKRKISELKNLGQTNIEISHRLYVQISECKPILRPLSDLHKEITIGKNIFVPHLILASEIIRLWQDFNYFKDNLTSLPYFSFQKLLEWHFDFFGLIDKGLAISIHDVEQVIA